MNQQPENTNDIPGKSHRWGRLLMVGLGALFFVLSTTVSQAQTYIVDSIFTVNSTADPGDGLCDAVECTLREAILAANATFGRHGIAFAIPGAGPHTIRPLTNLPDLTGVALIDGYTQPGAQPNTNPMTAPINAVLTIEIDFSLVSTGLRLNAPAMLVRGLVLNRSPERAISLLRHSSQITGNFIGVDSTGTMARPNMIGLYTAENTTSTVIGGSDPAARNLIAGNRLMGMLVTPAHGLTIAGNFIGVDVTGKNALGNRTGIEFGGSYTTQKWQIALGGTEPGARNLIAGNQIGVVLGYGSVTMENNLVGTDITGAAPLGNQDSGLELIGFAHRIRRNIFAYNGGNGIAVKSFPGPDNNIIADNQITNNGKNGIAVWGGWAEIQPNVIYNNNLLGIDLGTDGVTSNDVGDLDEGPNDLLNFPTILLSGSDGAEISLLGVMHTKPNRTIGLSFYANPICDSSMYGEGAIFLGMQPVNLGTNNTAFFTVHLPSTVPAGYGLSATASETIPNAPTTAVVTSEFAACRPIAGVINHRLRLVATSTQYVPYAVSPYPDARGGLLFLTATFENRSDRPINQLFFKVTTLTNNNFMFNLPDGGVAGVGALLSAADYLQPGATYSLVFAIGLRERKPFDFFVDAYGIVPGASASAETVAITDGFGYAIQDEVLQVIPELANHLYLPLVTQ